jgi:hypothetical protein
MIRLSPNPTIADIHYVADNLRPADLREAKAFTTVTPKTAVSASALASRELWAIKDGETTVAIFGVSASGQVWMVGTEGLRPHKKQFLRSSKPVVNELVKKYGKLWNYVDERNEEHIKWINWCGFTFTGKHTFFRDPTVKFLEFEQCA